MSEDNRYKLTYIICVIGEFAKKYRLSDKQAFNYLQRYKGLSFLDDCYSAEHTDSLNDAIDDLTMICNRNGGGLS